MLPRGENRNKRQSKTKANKPATAMAREGLAHLNHRQKFLSLTLGAITLVGAVSTAQASGQTVTPEQVEDLQKQIRLLEKKLESVQHKTFLNTSAGYMPTKGTFAPPDVLVSMKGGAPRICTTDGFNCVGLTGRLHFDVGAITTGRTRPQPCRRICRTASTHAVHVSASPAYSHATGYMR